MLTRLKVSGFKNLFDVDLHFGPFTCIAGENGVGKSNLFDAIIFLSNLADNTLIDAALKVREPKTKNPENLKNIFFKNGDTYAEEMSFEAEMIIPEEGSDDLEQPVKASVTFLKYSITIIYRSDGSIGLTKEELKKINYSGKNLLFKHSSKWKKSVIPGTKKTVPLISTKDDIVKIHQDGKQGGNPISKKIKTLPKTMLSTYFAEFPTVALAKREMQSWKLLQLEPSSLRKNSELGDAKKIGANGENLPATLYRLALQEENNVYVKLCNRLSELIDDVKEIFVDKDEKRQILTLQVKDKNGTLHSASSLSDGTLRFLALSTLELDAQAKGVLCLEEPENGIHPERITSMVKLLEDVATDTEEAVDEENPLRQVIISTHSPVVVSEVGAESLLIAELNEKIINDKRCKVIVFKPLKDTWRAKIEGLIPVSEGKWMSYIKPVLASEKKTNRRVADRPEISEQTSLELL